MAPIRNGRRKYCDVLKRDQAPAAFFLIGLQADKFSDVTDRIYREGMKSAATPSHIRTSAIFPALYAAVELN